MYAKDRQRLNMLKKPATSKVKPVAAVMGTNSTVQPNVSTESVQPTNSVSQVQNNLSDFISSLSVTGDSSSTPSVPEGAGSGNQAFSGLLNASLFGPNTVSGMGQVPTNMNPSQLQQQQQMFQMQMQIMLNQQLMFQQQQQSMGAFGPVPGLCVMPPFNPIAGLGIGANTLNSDNSGLTVNPSLGRGNRLSSNIRPVPGDLQKKE